MADKELSHQECALLFINNLQSELAKTNLSAQGHGSEKNQQQMAPPEKIRRLQIPRGDPQSEHKSQA
jgi:hypothetical protein